MVLLLSTLALAGPPEPELVWSSDGKRVHSHCLMDDGRWAAIQQDGLHRGPDLEPIARDFGKHTVVVGNCAYIAFADDREKQVHLLDPWTGEIRDVDTGVQFVQMAVAPDGRYLVVGGWADGDGIAVVDVKAGTARPLDGSVSHVDWRFSADGTLFWYAKTWKSPKPVIRDIDSLDKLKEEDVAGTAFSPAQHPSAYDAWSDEWALTDDIRVLTSEVGVMRVGSTEQRTAPFPMAAHRIQPLPDESLMVFRQQATRTVGISADIFMIRQARPALLRWYLEAPAP